MHGCPVFPGLIKQEVCQNCIRVAELVDGMEAEVNVLKKKGHSL